MKLARDDWARVLRHLDSALDLPEPQRGPWLDALLLDPPPLKDALRRLLADRRRIETADFLGAGAGLPPSPLQPGATVGPWRLQRELGRGGMASVWLAVRDDGAHQRPVALKLPHRLPGSEVLARRFLRERAILSTLQHPHIAQVLDAGDAGAQPWLALEYVDGRPLTVHAQAAGLDTAARLRLFLPVLQAVQHAHGQLVIHRDLKPSNVMVTADGQVKLLDFGVAKLLEADGGGGDAGGATALTELGGRAMTPQYASPEQVAGRPLGVASDVYALGVLLYELLTGRLPYTLRRDTAAALEEAILSAQLQRPSAAAADPRTMRALRGDVDTIVMKALQAEPAHRYASAEAMAQDIERHLQRRPILARPDTWAYRLRKLWARQRLAMTAGGVVVLAVAGGSGVALWQARQARAEAARAAAVQQFLLDIFKANSARQADPAKARATTARELLDLGAEGLDRALAGQPAARLSLLDTLREMYQDLGLTPKAAALARQAVDAAREQHGAGSEAHLLRLAQLADVLADAAGSDERGRVVAQALSLLPGSGSRRASAARTRVHIEAASFFQSARLDEAEAQSQRALADAQALADPVLLRRAWEVAGVTAQLRNDVALAEQRMAEAVRVGEAAGETGAALLRTRVQLADVQARRLRLAASEATLRAALATTLQVNGPAHLDTLQTRMALGFALLRTGRLREAEGEYTAVRTVLEAAPDPDGLAYPTMAGSLGRVLQAQGRSAEAQALLRRGIAVRDRTRPGTRMAAEMREFLVPPLLSLGRTDEAAAALAEATAIRTANGLKPGTRVWSLQAIAAHELALARGDTGAAAAALQALVAGSEADPPESLGWIDGTLLRAAFDVGQGRLDDAGARLQRLGALLADRQLAGTLPLVEGRRLTLCAAVAARQGDAARAADGYARAARLYAAELPPQAPLQREWARLQAGDAAARVSMASAAASAAPRAGPTGCG